MRLQIYPPTDYFLVMRTKGRLGQRAGSQSWQWALVVLTTIVLGTGCDERERLTFPTPSDGVGPVTFIDKPNGADTTVVAGALFSVQGSTTDQDGVDTVYFFVTGAGQGFSAFTPELSQTTVRFSLPLATFGHAGQTFEVHVYGVDALGNQGGTSSRLIHIR
jgi:hypothetical protein